MNDTKHCVQAGVIRALAWRPRYGATMTESTRQTVIAGSGFETETGRSCARGLTFLSAESWRDVCREIGVDLPWYTRRANLLVEGVDFAEIIGKTIAIGSVEVRIGGETKPCKFMDTAHPGLRAALKPALRGGVLGEVLVGGPIKVGNAISVLST